MQGDQYYVIWPDGQKFGPADVQTLQRWVVENRVGPGTLLENSRNGQQLRAGDVPALNAVLPFTPHTPPGYTSFAPSNVASGTTEVTIAWVLGGLGLLCCGLPVALAGLILAAFALSKKQPSAVGALILNIVALGVHALGFGIMNLPGMFN